MLPKESRLSRKDFKTLAPTKKVQSALFFATYTPPIQGGRGKTAIIISKKVAPKAVDRHELKRRMMHALSTLPKRTYHLTITAKVGSAHLSYSAILKELSALLARIA